MRQADRYRTMLPPIYGVGVLEEERIVRAVHVASHWGHNTMYGERRERPTLIYSRDFSTFSTPVKVDRLRSMLLKSTSAYSLQEA